MLLKKVIQVIKDADTNNLFCTDENKEFIEVINSITDVNSSHDIHKTISKYFDVFLQTDKKDDVYYIGAQRCLLVLDQFFNNMESQSLTNKMSSIPHINPFDEEFKKLNGLHVEDTDHEEMQINPSNQQFVSEKQNPQAADEGCRILNEKTFRNEYFNEETDESFFLKPEECEKIRKIDFNEEILGIYTKSLKLFAREINQECLHRHCYYLETDGKWENEQ
ncbi:hypothetical protein EHP00_1221 [Ecytonucleospora hepatopenaei]|uniref:Uncharacterized protein n=1 Tax=Ecytonucleospora hepatopenaei TaxID=646526 RepID=A0A1W0E7Z2_9MICR|nr:hypothetical protein EHP00_1221 [Ecytonucleospora hepatopenaei]